MYNVNFLHRMYNTELPIMWNFYLKMCKCKLRKVFEEGKVILFYFTADLLAFVFWDNVLCIKNHIAKAFHLKYDCE